MATIFQALEDPQALPSVEAVANRCYITQTHARRLLRQILGDTLAGIVRRFRIYRSCYDLLYSGLSYAAAARRADYTSTASFARAVERCLGISAEWFTRPRSTGRLVNPAQIHLRAARRPRQRFICIPAFIPLSATRPFVAGMAHDLRLPVGATVTCFVYDDPGRYPNDLVRQDICAPAADAPDRPLSHLGHQATPAEIGLETEHVGPAELAEFSFIRLSLQAQALGYLTPEDHVLPVRIDHRISWHGLPGPRSTIFVPAGGRSDESL